MAINNKMTAKYNLSGKVGLVTGSSAGIGEAIAIELVRCGARVVITGRDATKLANVAERVRRASPNCDTVETPVVLQVVGDLLTDPLLPSKLIDQTVTTFGRLDVLVNNAGSTRPDSTLASASLLQSFDEVFRLNVRSVLELTQLAVPHLERSKGNIINISSVLSLMPYTLIYGASKAALDMITKTSALELGPNGIRVNSVNPGIVVSEFMRSVGLQQKPQQEEFYRQKVSNSLMGRIGSVQDIANLVAFVASEDARNITGSILLSDSGLMVRGTFN